MDNFIFDEIFSSIENYNSVKSDLKHNVLNNFQIRKNPATIIVKGHNIETTIGSVLLNLILLRPLVGIELQIEDLFQEENVTDKTLKNLINNIIQKYKNNNLDYNVARKLIHDSISEASDISSYVNVSAGNGLSYLGFLKVINDPEADHIINPKIKTGQFNEIEGQFSALGKEIVNYYKNKPDSELHPYIMTETGVNNKQLTQFMGFVGLKPDIDGSVIPVTIEDNFLKGLSGLESYFINSKGTRQALIVNFRHVRTSGYLTRKLCLSMIDRFHDNSLEDCGTKHCLNYNIENEDRFKQIIGRHYYDQDSEGNIYGELKTVKKSDKDTLVGKTISLRSPVCCSGKHVCATCYGKELSKVNENINTGIAAVLKITEPMTQKLLSAKHLLTTSTEKINWGDIFSEFFYANMNAVYFSGTECTVTFKKPNMEDFNEEENAFEIKEFQIQPAGSKKILNYESPVVLFLNPKLLSNDIETESITITPDLVEEDEFIFKYQTKNNVISKSLQQIIDLIESSSHLGISDYHEFVNKFNNLLIANGLGYVQSVHIEMITSNLIRDIETGKRLDFSKDMINDYTIARVSKSVMNAPISVSLSFERINDQLTDLNTYKKDEDSMMDYLFR